MVMTALPTTALMPGRWPTDLRSPAGAEDNLHFNTPVSPIGEEDQRSRIIPPYPLSTEEIPQISRSLGLGDEAQRRPTSPSPCPASPSIPDELFFDCPSPSLISTM